MSGVSPQQRNWYIGVGIEWPKNKFYTLTRWYWYELAQKSRFVSLWQRPAPLLFEMTHWYWYEWAKKWWSWILSRGSVHICAVTSALIWIAKPFCLLSHRQRSAHIWADSSVFLLISQTIEVGVWVLSNEADTSALVLIGQKDKVYKLTPRCDMN